MNPYIEQDAYWQDFHLEFLPAIRERLVAQMRPKYIVTLDEHICVHELSHEPRKVASAMFHVQRVKSPRGAFGRVIRPATSTVRPQDEFSPVESSPSRSQRQQREAMRAEGTQEARTFNHGMN